ncbi:origin recognition complex subunit 3 [Plodia interpunctella]|uniref:origin recognition complex subunit 3 n=1 Tax=Plodia interpunctella TaxID=58824 RepID=UPI0023679F70|nr:origin recognition complex subunit 3 [Plodia interpunctella]
MESTVSVSKGVFLFKNGFKKVKNPKKKTQNKNFFEKSFGKQPWYVAFKRNWKIIEDEIKNLQHRTYNTLLNDIVNYIKSFHNQETSDSLETIIPSATLLTGVNQPDHFSQFAALIDKIREEVTPHIAMISSQDAPTVKHLVENTVWQLIHGHEKLESIDEEDDDLKGTKKLKKNQCTFKTLKQWYTSQFLGQSPRKKRHGSMSSRSMVIIIPDFESFNCNVLQDFVMIASSYVPSLPLVFVFGVATSVSALHKSFPYHVSSKLLIKVFHSQASPVYMNQVLEDIFLTHTSPFHLSAKTFELLTDVFLFYDFSVTGLIQSIKYCMMDHYYGDNTKTLCCERSKIEEAITKLTTEDLENIRQLMSFRPFLESQEDCQTRISLFEDDAFFREVLCSEINILQDYIYTFYTCLRILLAFVKDLPKNLLGKSVREIYTKCAQENVTSTQAFKECMQLINFQSQVKLVDSIKNALKIVNTALQVVSPVKPLRTTPSKSNVDNIVINHDTGENFVKAIRVHLMMFSRQIENASTECSVISEVVDDENEVENVPGNRYKLKEKLLKATRVDKVQSEFSMVRSRFVSYLEETLSAGLQPPPTRALHELRWAARGRVCARLLGAPRAALHTALTNPVHYLQCSCCRLPSADSVGRSLPDVCAAYKLHRECGKLINLFDWLQAFAAVLRPDVDTDDSQEDTAVHVRFNRAVAELQFLGFIKSSKRKTDHVMRLTW